ncbi:hypothetical protein DOC35_19450 [Salmonella enterica subsp. enterica]|nr:hypothetical protein [Salmonella enterica subsp. enterica]
MELSFNTRSISEAELQALLYSQFADVKTAPALFDGPFCVLHIGGKRATNELLPCYSQAIGRAVDMLFYIMDNEGTHTHKGEFTFKPIRAGQAMPMIVIEFGTAADRIAPQSITIYPRWDIEK